MVDRLLLTSLGARSRSQAWTRPKLHFRCMAHSGGCVAVSRFPAAATAYMASHSRYGASSDTRNRPHSGYTGRPVVTVLLVSRTLSASNDYRERQRTGRSASVRKPRSRSALIVRLNINRGLYVVVPRSHAGRRNVSSTADQRENVPLTNLYLETLDRYGHTASLIGLRRGVDNRLHQMRAVPCQSKTKT